MVEKPVRLPNTIRISIANPHSRTWTEMGMPHGSISLFRVPTNRIKPQWWHTESIGESPKHRTIGLLPGGQWLVADFDQKTVDTRRRADSIGLVGRQPLLPMAPSPFS
jgi:hypothetical protein